jgi:hypothetical protein
MCHHVRVNAKPAILRGKATLVNQTLKNQFAKKPQAFSRRFLARIRFSNLIVNSRNRLLNQ